MYGKVEGGGGSRSKLRLDVMIVCRGEGRGGVNHNAVNAKSYDGKFPLRCLKKGRKKL